MAAEEIKETYATSTSTEAPSGETKEKTYEKLYGQQTQTQQQTAQTMTLPPELTESLSLIPQLAQEVTALKQKLSPPPPEANPEEWVEKIRTGDFKGARESLFQEFKKTVDPELTSRSREAEGRALQAMQVQLQIDNYLNQVRSTNPDIVPYERYLKAPVDAAVQAEIQAGKIKNPDQYISAYRRAVDNEVEALRNLRLQERAGGKQEAMTRTREVLSATPLAPNQTSNRTTETTKENASDETPMDYITRRQQAHNRTRGLTS